MSFARHVLAVAPMLDVTDAPMRYLLRLLSPTALLYTEMLHMNAALSLPMDRLKFWLGDVDSQTVIQLGGTAHQDVGGSMKRIIDALGVESNVRFQLNAGCPSHAASSGLFGAALMLQPTLLLKTLESMASAVENNNQVELKCRLGIANHDMKPLESILQGCQSLGIFNVTLHAREAVLGKRFSTKDNLTIPPLTPERVYQVVEQFPKLKFLYNGGITSVENAKDHLLSQPKLHGLMIGRAIQTDPGFIASLESALYLQPSPNRFLIMKKYLQKADQVLETHSQTDFKVIPLLSLLRQWIRPIQKLFHHQPLAKACRDRLLHSMQQLNISSTTLNDAKQVIQSLNDEVERVQQVLVKVEEDCREREKLLRVQDGHSVWARHPI